MDQPNAPVPIDVPPELVEAIAERTAARVVEMLREVGEGPRMLSATEVAGRLGRSVDWVRGHRVELGCVPLGDGPKPRLGFPVERVDAYSEGRRTAGAANPAAKPKARHRKGPSKRQGDPYLPIRGEAPA